MLMLASKVLQQMVLSFPPLLRTVCLPNFSERACFHNCSEHVNSGVYSAALSSHISGDSVRSTCLQVIWASAQPLETMARRTRAVQLQPPHTLCRLQQARGHQNQKGVYMLRTILRMHACTWRRRSAAHPQVRPRLCTLHPAGH